MRFRKYSVDLALSLVVLIWAISPSFFKIVLEELTPFAFTYVRFLLMSLISLLVLWVHARRGGRAWKIERRDLLPLILSGLSGYGIYQVLYIVGLSLTTVFASALLMATVPLFSAMILAAFRTERVGGVQWLGVLLAFCGVALFLLAGTGLKQQAQVDRHLTTQTMILGDLMTLVGAVSFAMYGIINKKLTLRFSQAELMCYTLLVGTVALAPVGIPALLAQHWEKVTWPSWLVIAYAVVFPIYVSYTIWNWAIGLRGVGYVTLYNYLVPILGGVVSFLVLGEQFSPGQLGGAAVVVAGLLVARRGMTLRTRAAKAQDASASAGEDALVVGNLELAEAESAKKQAADSLLISD
ncbi:MAG TPA: DMT family transporter [Ktedonobacterales bacterium]